jgi:hypothetical protein
LNTTATVIATLQNTVVVFNTLTLTYLLIVGIAAQLVGIWAFWTVQKRKHHLSTLAKISLRKMQPNNPPGFSLSTKVMFDAVMLGIILLDGWGMIGIWTQKFGFHNEWEFWLYQVFYGLFVCHWYSYSQIMISEVTPSGKEFLFFSLFSIMGKTSAFIGPIVSSAIIDHSASRNNSLPFYFLFGLSILSMLLLAIFVDLKKSRKEQEEFLAEERAAKERRANVIISKGVGLNMAELASSRSSDEKRDLSV